MKEIDFIPSSPQPSWVKIPPHYNFHLETFSKWRMSLNRTYSLSLEEDVIELKRFAQNIPEYSSAFDNYFDTFLQIFTEEHWRTVYDGLTIVIDIGDKQMIGYEFPYLLDIARKYQLLEKYDVDKKLIQGLRNPPQIASTLFEIETAAFCVTRTISQSMEFSPEVTRNGKIKRPDFLWKTSLGDIYCECKQAGIFGNKFKSRMGTINDYLEKRLKTFEIPKELRLDFEIERTGYAENSINHILNELKIPLEGQQCEHGHVKLHVRSRSQELEPTAVSVKTSNIATSAGMTKASEQSAPSTVTVHSTRFWNTVCSKLISDARTQVPVDRPSAIFLGLSTERVGKAVFPKVTELILQPSFGNTPCIVICAQGGMSLIARNGQPFDTSIGDPLDVKP